MSESAQHQQLVNQIIEAVSAMVGNERSCFIMSDAADSSSVPPQTVEGFRPDVFYLYDDLLIIGEAKTSKDIDREHSRSQYASYMKKCSIFRGKAIFIIAVPWTDHATANNIVKKMKKTMQDNFELLILDGIGGAI